MANVAKAQSDDKNNNRDLDGDDGGVEAGAFLDADHQNRRDHQRDDEGRQIEADLIAEQMRRIQQIMSLLQQLGRLRSHDAGHFVEKSLRAGHQRGIGGLRHLASDNILGCLQAGPVVVRQPQRHFDIENIQQLDEVIGPSRRHGAGAHGVFEREVPADDPGEDFAERRISIGVSAARERNHGRKLRIAQSCEGAAQAGENEREHQPWSGIVRAQSGENEDSCANHRANSRAPSTGNTPSVRFKLCEPVSRASLREGKRLFRKEVRHESRLSCFN